MSFIWANSKVSLPVVPDALLRSAYQASKSEPAAPTSLKYSRSASSPERIENCRSACITEAGAGTFIVFSCCFESQNGGSTNGQKKKGRRRTAPPPQVQFRRT